MKMRRHLHLTTILPAIALGVALLLGQGATNTAHADWKPYFIKSSASSCLEFYSAMAAEHGTGFSGTVYADVLATGIADGVYDDSVGLGGIQSISVDAADDRTSFTWEDVTVPADEFDTVGINMVCIKAGNGRTCWKTKFDKDTKPTQVFSDLNTTSKIGNAWFCSDSEAAIASGGPDCPYSGETLHDIFGALGSKHSILTLYDGQGKPSNCAAPDPATNLTIFSNCSADDAYAPIGDDPDGTDGNGICDPTTETCCRVDNVCAQAYSSAGDIAANCTLNVGGPTTGTGYSKGGDNTCITFGPSGSGSPMQVCW
jgi:hypothetical protein